MSSDISPASPRCPKCFAGVPEEAAQCPQCSFDFAALSRPKSSQAAKQTTPVIEPVMLKPKPELKAESKPEPGPVPMAVSVSRRETKIKKEAPVRRSNPSRHAPARNTRNTEGNLRWSHVFMALALLITLSLAGFAGLSSWILPTSSQLAVNTAVMAEPTTQNPFERRFPDATDDLAQAQSLAGSFSNQLQAMHAAF